VAKALTDDERRTAELLDAAGLPRPPARCLVLLARGGWWLAADLAEAGSLTPQEVSEGVRLLETRGALRKEAVAKAGPGRPPLRYHLAGEAREMLSRIERDARAALERDLALLDELRGKLGG
jgi:predicted transcriptional regulator